MMWRRIEADGCEWEVRATAHQTLPIGGDASERGEVLEFQCLRGDRPARRVMIEPGALSSMSEDDLRATYRKALPISGDHYGRPGKRMPDMGV